MSDAILQARGLRKSFPSGDRRIEVLQRADLAVAAGETVSIRGESGSGKSTLLSLLAGLDSFDAGELFWEGEAVAPLDFSARAGRRPRFLGMVFQSFHLMPELDAHANVLLSARIAGRMGAAERSRAGELLRRVGLAGRGHHLPAQLSGGESQRVAVARALMNRPKLILADEPTGNLDEKTGEAVIGLLLEVCAEQNTALVLVTHNAAYAARCGRQLLLHDGVLQEVQGSKFKVQE